jgi:methionyl-tRNA formyltransferase
MRTFGDNVITRTSKFDTNYLKEEKIDFIVSDRTQFLLGKEIIDFLPKRIINLHPSFLPWGRGYYPNFFSIALGFPHGVSIHFIDEGIDSGDLIAQTRINFSPTDTFRETYYRLRNHMISLFKTVWPELRLGKLEGFSQDLKLGNIFYKKDLEKFTNDLSHGWDTKISNYLHPHSFARNSDPVI